MNNLHFEKLKETIEKKDVKIWNEFVSTLDIQIDLSFAKLINTDLRGANLLGADLSGADLRGADLSGADLRGANLYCVKLHFAHLISADLNNADLRGVNLYCANLSDANLYDVNLYDANLIGADLSNANLKGANTYGISTTTFKGSRHFAVQIGEFISIGCYTLKISKWLKRADKIAKIENYTNEEKNEYLKYINECKEKM